MKRIFKRPFSSLSSCQGCNRLSWSRCDGRKETESGSGEGKMKKRARKERKQDRIHGTGAMMSDIVSVWCPSSSPFIRFEPLPYLNLKPSMSFTRGLMLMVGNARGVLCSCSLRASTWFTYTCASPIECTKSPEEEQDNREWKGIKW